MDAAGGATPPPAAALPAPVRPQDDFPDPPASLDSLLANLPPLAELPSAEATLDAAEGMDAVQRRLMFVRYLVRQRIYNEGFSANALPEQYRWESGIEDLDDN
jgi:hypothetical protein